MKLLRKLKLEFGVTTVEATVVLPVLLLFLITGVSMSAGLFRALTFEHVLMRSAREAIIAPGDDDRLATIEQRVQELASDYGVALSSENIRVCRAWESECQAGAGEENAGGPNDYITLSVTVPIPVLFSYSFDLNFRLFTRNEPS